MPDVVSRKRVDEDGCIVSARADVVTASANDGLSIVPAEAADGRSIVPATAVGKAPYSLQQGNAPHSLQQGKAPYSLQQGKAPYSYSYTIGFDSCFLPEVNSRKKVSAETDSITASAVDEERRKRREMDFRKVKSDFRKTSADSGLRSGLVRTQ